MADLKDYFYNLSSRPYIEIKRFIYEYTNQYVPSLLIELNTEFILCYTNKMEELNSWKEGKEHDFMGDLIEEDIDSLTNVLVRNYKYSEGIFEIQEINHQFENLNYSEHRKMSRIIHPFQFCIHAIIEEENSKLIKLNAITFKLNDVATFKNKSDELPFNRLFPSTEVYECFMVYQKHIIDYYGDYSYLKKRMEHEGLMHNHKDNQFMEIIFKEMNLISEKDYNDYKVRGKLDSLKRASNDQRENNFNLIFEGFLNPKKIR